MINMTDMLLSRQKDCSPNENEKQANDKRNHIREAKQRSCFVACSWAGRDPIIVTALRGDQVEYIS